MEQNPSKHSDYMQVLKTLLKGLGVEISHTSFKELFSLPLKNIAAIEKYLIWLDPDKGTLRHEEWQEVTCCLCLAYQSGEKIPMPMASRES